jgi:glucosamine--fructose-6-phosphate aminotransferase (isomerizing)
VGGVSLANAHPHFDCSGELAIVHNGDIDNFHLLRQRLQHQGHQFCSETDSEVIAHLIEAYCGDDIVAATSRAIGELEGPFALVVLHRPSRRLVVARRDSPLVVGLGDGETFIASDVPAILPYTNRIVYLEDGDLALVWEGGLTIWQNGFEADRPVHQVSWSADQINKGGYDHFMLKEIHEQPDAIRDTMAQGMPVPAASLAAAQGLLPVLEPDALLLLGCGTSYHTALVGEQLLTQLLPVPVTARVASEFQRPIIKAERGLAVAFSQSGETSDTLAALRRVRSAGYAALGVTNVMGSSMTRAVDATLYTRAGPEVAVASTKTFISQLVALYLLGYYLSPDREAVAALPQNLRSLPSKVRQTLATEPVVQQAARELAGCEHMFIVAKGLGGPSGPGGGPQVQGSGLPAHRGVSGGRAQAWPFCNAQRGDGGNRPGA